MPEPKYERGMSAEAIDAVLRSLGFLGESLLGDVRWRRYGYSVELIFNYVWDRGGRIRPDVEGTPWLVTISCEGVERLTVKGGLSDAMKREPNQIGWGLSEVAVVRAEPCSVLDGIGVAVTASWESDRELRVEAVSATIDLPPELVDLS